MDCIDGSHDYDANQKNIKAAVSKWAANYLGKPRPLSDSTTCDLYLCFHTLCSFLPHSLPHKERDQPANRFGPRAEEVPARASAGLPANDVGPPELEVGVRVLAEDPMTGERRHCCSAYLTFVALSPEGQPTKLPALELGDDESFHRRAKEANIRKAHRLELKRLRQKDAERD